jgi:hypothetical protein
MPTLAFDYLLSDYRGASRVVTRRSAANVSRECGLGGIAILKESSRRTTCNVVMGRGGALVSVLRPSDVRKNKGSTASVVADRETVSTRNQRCNQIYSSHNEAEGTHRSIYREIEPKCRAEEESSWIEQFELPASHVKAKRH